MTSYISALFMGPGEAWSARWALGSLLLAPLAAATSGYTTVPAVLLLAACLYLAANTNNDLKKLAEILPAPKTSRGRRERNLQSFGDFMAIWVWFLSHLVAVAVCARVLSSTADHVTGGKTRRWLFGYETRALGEPWPDVLGVTVVIVVCAMFMCGLEESMMFTLMLLVLLYIFSQFFAIVGIMNFDVTDIHMPAPISAYELFAAGAPISYAFSATYPAKESSRPHLKSLLIFGLPTLLLSGLCFLYANMLKEDKIDAALPVMTLLEAKTAGWISPLLAAVTVSGICLALTELCPLLFGVLVALASPEWKVLTRSLTYESATTGSPVLAVFTAGSLAAILAFACPLSHMIALMNGSHLLGIAVQAFQFTILRCVPTPEQIENGDVEYKRLGTCSASQPAKAVKTKSGLWFLPAALRHTKTFESLKSKTNKSTEERECLLLDEYAVAETASTCGRAVAEDPTSDVEPSEPEATSGDDSTDIDAVVKEYKDRVHVVTTIPEANNVVVPAGVRGARVSCVGAATQCVAAGLTAAGVCAPHARLVLLATGIPVFLVGMALSTTQPAHKLDSSWLQKVQGPITLLASILFLTPLLLDSWPAISLFALAGAVIYLRCERWCGDLAVRQARVASDRRKLHPSALQARVSSAALTHLDTLYITR